MVYFFFLETDSYGILVFFLTEFYGILVVELRLNMYVCRVTDTKIGWYVKVDMFPRIINKTCD